jgi:hypothetical protein
MSPYTNTNNTNATSNKTNIGILHQNAGLELSERDEEKLKIRKGLYEVIIRKKIDNTMVKRTVKTSNGRHRKLKINNNYSLYILYHIIFTPCKPQQDITEILQDVVTH